MSRVLMIGFVFVLMAGFVVAVASEVGVDFVVSDNQASVGGAPLQVSSEDGNVGGEVESILVPSFWESYGGQIVAIVVLVGIYILFRLGRKKRKVGSRRSVVGRKGSGKKGKGKKVNSKKRK